MSHNEQNFAEQIRAQGHRLTPQRELILDTLCNIGDHATIQRIYDEVHASAPAIDRATIYRSLHFFEQLRLVVSAEIDNTIVYEIAHEEPHHHLVCTSCNSVMQLDNHHFTHLTEHLLTEHGFQADINHLTIEGVCSNCSTQA